MYGCKQSLDRILKLFRVHTRHLASLTTVLLLRRWACSVPRRNAEARNTRVESCGIAPVALLIHQSLRTPTEVAVHSTASVNGKVRVLGICCWRPVGREQALSTSLLASHWLPAPHPIIWLSSTEGSRSGASQIRRYVVHFEPSESRAPMSLSSLRDGACQEADPLCWQRFSPITFCKALHLLCIACLVLASDNVTSASVKSQDTMAYCI